MTTGFSINNRQAVPSRFPALIYVIILSLFAGYPALVQGQNVTSATTEGLVPCIDKIYGYSLDPAALPADLKNTINWTIEPYGAGKFMSAGIKTYNTSIQWNDIVETANIKVTSRTVTRVFDDGYPGGRWIDVPVDIVLGNITIHPKRATPVLSIFDAPNAPKFGASNNLTAQYGVCEGTRSDLNDSTNLIVKKVGSKTVRDGHWTGPGIEGGHFFNASGLETGKTYEVYFWETGKTADDYCSNNTSNRLYIQIMKHIFQDEDMLVLTPAEAGAGIPLSPDLSWSGQNLSGPIGQQLFQTTQEGNYELSFINNLTCRKGKKVVIVKSDEALPASSVSYVQTTTVLKENITDVSAIGNLPVGEVFSQRTYFDVFGRPIQSIARQASPTGKDIVGFAIYDDPLGRSTKQYMGFTEGTDGALKSNVLGKQQVFYQNTPGIAHSDYAYGKVEYENSAFSRVKSVYAPGEGWVAAGVKSTLKQSVNGADYVRMLGSGFGDAPTSLEKLAGIESEIILTAYDNAQNDVKAKAGIEILQGFEIGEGGELALTIMEIPGEVHEDLLIRNQFYPANELLMVETRDEHGVASHSYTNKSGLTVMSEAQSDESETKFLQTYYVYDDFGQLRYTFPPKAVELLKANGWKITNDILKLTFYSQYDHRGRPIVSKVPDKGEIYTVYDILNRPVLSQDALQRAKSPQEWSFVKYDLYGRSVLSGVYKSNLGREALQQLADKANQSLPNPSYRLYEEKTGDAVWGHYTNQAFPTLFPADQLEMVSYYDHYNFDEQGGADAAYDDLYDVNFSGNKPIPSYTRMLGRPTGSMTRLDNPDGSFKKWLKTYVFYDDKGRVIQGQSGNHLGGTDIATIQYDYPGKVLATHLKHETVQTNVTQTIQVKERYEYDFLGRPLRSFQTIQKDSEAAVLEEKLSEVRYNELGQVVEKKLGNGNLQTLDFNYNIRGWLTKFNDLGNLGIGKDKDLFAFTLHYEDAANPTRSRLDGMVSSMEWKTASDDVTRGYSYQYDALGQLKNATYTGGNTGENYTENNLGYDANGNIKTLDRFGLASAGNYGKTDQLVYNYDGNRLLSVTDAIINTTGIAGDFQDKNKTGNDYEYDLNGNLIRDRNKEIASIKYNSMDMPVVILWENGNKIEYQYDRTGNKLNSKAYQKTAGGVESLVRETDYVGGFVYEKNELSYMGTGEGRYLFKIRDVPSGGRTQGYEYYLTDHQGNLRVSFRKGDTLVYTAGMEIQNSVQEAREFDNVVNVRSNPGQGRTGNFAAKIDQSIPMGIWKTLKVSKGDKVDAEVWARYTQDNTQNNRSGLGVYATTQVPSIATDPDKPSGNSAPLLALGISYAPNQNPNNSNAVPRAYLIGILYDTEGNPVETHRVEVTSDAKNNWKQLTKSITVSQAGQLQIFVANEGNVAVFFDDMKITLSQQLISQENHYSPFGVNLVGIEKTGTNRFLYNAMTEKNSDFDLDWYETPFRSYDAQIGRFHQVDKLAGLYPGITTYNYALNNPVMFNDPTGLYADAREDDVNDPNQHPTGRRGSDDSGPDTGRLRRSGRMAAMTYSYGYRSSYSYAGSLPSYNREPGDYSGGRSSGGGDGFVSPTTTPKNTGWTYTGSGGTDYTLNKTTGLISKVGENNSNMDRIIRYNKKGGVRIKIRDIEKGILKDGQNFRTGNTLIEVGGEGQPSVEGVKSFTLKLSEYVGKEIKGFSYSSDGSGNITDMELAKYKENLNTKSFGYITKIIKKYGANFSSNNILEQFHTHPDGELGATESATKISSDVETLQLDKPKMSNASFIILYRIRDQLEPEEYDYTHEYIPIKPKKKR